MINESYRPTSVVSIQSNLKLNISLSSLLTYKNVIHNDQFGLNSELQVCFNLIKSTFNSLK